MFSPKKSCKRYKFVLIGVFLILCLQFSLLSFSSFTNETQKEASKLLKFETNKPTDRNKTNGPDPPSSKHRGLRSSKFEPKCQIQGKEAISALSRAKTVQCKQEIADVSCLSSAGKLFPTELINYCPHAGNKSTGFYFGCYQDVAEQRDLTHAKDLSGSNSPDKCVKYCTNGGYMYAGLQYERECWCGDRFGIHGKIPDSKCHHACPGDPTKLCGGYLTNSIYSTGLGAKIKNREEFNEVLNDDSPSIKIVFVLTLNGRAARQVRRLLRAIYHRDHFYYIHVDNRQQYLYNELLPLETLLPNVRFTRNRLATIWGGASLLQAHLGFIKELLEMTEWNWDYFINLSESDYPLKKVDSLVTFLTKHNGHVFLKSHGRETPKFIRKQGLNQIFYECDNHLWRLGPRELPKNIRFDGGSDWLALHRSFCQYVVSSDPLLDGLKEFYKYTLLPSESFFHTVLHNSKFCDKWIDNNLHLTNWNRQKGCKCQNKHIVDWCGCSPNDFKSADLERLMMFEKRTRFFARKFEPSVNQDIINSLDLYLFKERAKDMKSYTKYWENEYHYLDQTSNKTDTYLTFYGSFQRRSLETLKSSFCSLIPLQILESNAYFLEDHLNGVLVLYEAQHRDSGKTIILESHFSRKLPYIITNPQDQIGRLLSLEVGTDYDLKESMFRNFGQLIGPYSDITLQHSWTSGDSLTVAVAWVDPVDVIAASYDIEVPMTSHIGSHKPALKGPLRPGVWKVKLMLKYEVVAETSFLVVPLTTFHNKPITLQQALETNNGPKGLYIEKDFKDFSHVLGVNQSALIQKEAKLNGKKTGQSLYQWVDSLTAKFFEFRNICISSENTKGCPSLDVCQKTSWSSKSEDPKSEIIGVDPLTDSLN